MAKKNFNQQGIHTLQITIYSEIVLLNLPALRNNYSYTLTTTLFVLLWCESGEWRPSVGEDSIGCVMCSRKV